MIKDIDGILVFHLLDFLFKALVLIVENILHQIGTKQGALRMWQSMAVGDSVWLNNTKLKKVAATTFFNSIV